MMAEKTVIPVKSVTATRETGCASACASASTCSSASACSSDDPGVRLAQQGWIRRTTIGEPRLSEIAENYRTMGYEVHVEHFRTAGDEGECTTCYDAADQSGAGEVWGTVYVRHRPAADGGDELY